MTLSPKLIGPAIALITGLITSTGMSFVGLALNYGFQPDFALRWLRPRQRATCWSYRCW